MDEETLALILVAIVAYATIIVGFVWPIFDDPLSKKRKKEGDADAAKSDVAKGGA